jgi:hypothetical protein
MFELDHVTRRPVRMLLPASRVVAEIRTVAPVTRLDDEGETDTDATGTTAGAVTTSAAAPLCPSLDAVICVVPVATAVIMPAPDDVAAFTLVDDQTTARPVSTLLFESRSVAVACSVCPTGREPAVRSTWTDATGTTAPVEAVTVTVALALLHP